MYNPNSPIKLRIKEYCKATKNTPSGMEKACGFSNGYFNSLKGSPGVDKMESIRINFPELNLNWLVSGEGNMFNVEPIQVAPKSPERHFFAPLLPFTEKGVSLESLSQSDEEFEEIACPIKHVDWILPVIGDSMAPDYPNGSLIAIKRVGEYARIMANEEYVFDTENGPIFRRIGNGPNNEEFLCVPINEKYKPSVLSRKDVLGLYKVILSMIFK